MSAPTIQTMAAIQAPGETGSSRSAEAVVEATVSDREDVARTLALAFQDDPVFRWMLPDANVRRRGLPSLFDLLFRVEIAKGEILKSPQADAASFWRPPGKAGTSVVDVLRSAWPLMHIFGARIGRALTVSNSIEAHFPTDTPFWYVHFVGVKPSVQRQGWGSAMMRAGIALAETQGAPVYLETARPENVAFYQGHGFAVSEEWTVENGPHFWSMLRASAQSSA